MSIGLAVSRLQGVESGKHCGRVMAFIMMVTIGFLPLIGALWVRMLQAAVLCVQVRGKLSRREMGDLGLAGGDPRVAEKFYLELMKLSRQTFSQTSSQRKQSHVQSTTTTSGTAGDIKAQGLGHVYFSH